VVPTMEIGASLRSFCMESSATTPACVWMCGLEESQLRVLKTGSRAKWSRLPMAPRVHTLHIPRPLVYEHTHEYQIPAHIRELLWEGYSHPVFAAQCTLRRLHVPRQESWEAVLRIPISVRHLHLDQQLTKIECAMEESRMRTCTLYRVPPTWTSLPRALRQLRCEHIPLGCAFPEGLRVLVLKHQLGSFAPLPDSLRYASVICDFMHHVRVMYNAQTSQLHSLRLENVITDTTLAITPSMHTLSVVECSPAALTQLIQPPVCRLRELCIASGLISEHALHIPSSVVACDLGRMRSAYRFDADSVLQYFTMPRSTSEQNEPLPRSLVNLKLDVHANHAFAVHEPNFVHSITLEQEFRVSPAMRMPASLQVLILQREDQRRSVVCADKTYIMDKHEARI
jgi:hypothetical protein